MRVLGWVVVWLGCAGAAAGQQMPAAVVGTWRISRVVARSQGACWDAKRAGELVGSTLRYGPGSLTWKGGQVAVTEALSRTVSARDWRSESGLELAAVGVRAASVREIDLQHEDMDVTGVTTEVPGDTVVLAGPGRIVVSACGVYLEALRVGR